MIPYTELVCSPVIGSPDLVQTESGSVATKLCNRLICSPGTILETGTDNADARTNCGWHHETCCATVDLNPKDSCGRPMPAITACAPAGLDMVPSSPYLRISAPVVRCPRLQKRFLFGRYTSISLRPPATAATMSKEVMCTMPSATNKLSDS